MTPRGVGRAARIDEQPPADAVTGDAAGPSVPPPARPAPDLGDAGAKRRNLEFFLGNIEAYRKGVEGLDTYERLRRCLDRELTGIDELLDIGNGGVFDYDTGLVGHITAVDLFFDKLPDEAFDVYFPKNCTAKTGDALHLPEPDDRYDGVLMVMLLHHLVGKRSREHRPLLRQAIAEAHRVCRPGGKVVIAESCVARWFHACEVVAFDLLSAAINAFGRHPATFQYTVPILQEEMAAVFGDVTVEKVPHGRWILQFGHKWPSVLTPAQQYVFVATKR